VSELRILGPGDEQRLECFLAAHAESSMFLRSNEPARGRDRLLRQGALGFRRTGD
jgi:hypothetical protein